MKRTKTLLLLMLIQVSFLFSQRHEIGVFGGVSIYQGDLVFNSLSTEGSKLGVGFFYKNHYSEKIAIRAGVNSGRYSGSDSFFQNDIPGRNFSFETNYIDFSIGAEYLFLGGTSNFGKFKRFFSPYIHVGLGGVYANPEVTVSGRTELNPEDLEFSKLHFMVPISAGIKLVITERLSVDFEFSARTPFSDYLDGISISANPDKNDWYHLLGLNIGYKIGNAPIIRGN